MGYKLIFPGDPYKSSIFRKAHGGIASEDVKLDPNEGSTMPQNGVPLEPEAAEQIRQWILYGAPETGTPVNDQLISDYYNGKGMRAIPTPPAAPAAGKGFQIHMGPFFLPPTSAQRRSETEYFSKYATQLPKTVEITRIEPHMGEGYSHHFILYRYNDGKENQKPYGLRFDNAHLYTTIVSAHQDGQAVDLPQYTAFDWGKDTYLDLNSHYINFSTTKVLACDVYLNIYTQPAGTAKQIMQTALIPNTDIYVPNDSQLHTFTMPVFTNDFNYDFYVWAMGSHTHQCGVSYQIYRRNKDGSIGDQLYEGACKDGMPDCMSGNYDYQHPSTRTWKPFIKVNSTEGFIQRATYRNSGPAPVKWGDKSTDEMMVMAFMYTMDTTGLFPPPPPPKDTTVTDTTTTHDGDSTHNDTTGTHTGIYKRIPSAQRLTVSPNPVQTTAIFHFSSPLDAGSRLVIYDITGKEIERTEHPGNGRNSYIFQRKNLPPGLYFYKLYDGLSGEPLTGKLIISK
jgi:hypothetical protein